nr:MAG: internal scaffolding protein [Microvirus sp.]
MSYNVSQRTVLSDDKHNQIKSAYSKKIKQNISFPSQSPHTRQEFKDECDINTIMAQYERTGELFHINEAAPQYMDCNGDDFRASMDYIAGAFSMFEELPSKIRAQFDNDPAAFLDFTSREKNLPEMAAMGLLSPDAASRILTPQPTATTAPTAPPAASTPSEPPPQKDA